MASRQCNSPAPANGGKYCTGSRLRFRSCHVEKCPVVDGKQPRDFRSEQCANFNGQHIPLLGAAARHTWIPKYADVHRRDRCKLICQSVQTGAYITLEDRVVDGTRWVGGDDRPFPLVSRAPRPQFALFTACCALFRTGAARTQPTFACTASAWQPAATACSDRRQSSTNAEFATAASRAASACEVRARCHKITLVCRHRRPLFSRRSRIVCADCTGLNCSGYRYPVAGLTLQRRTLWPYKDACSIGAVYPVSLWGARCSECVV